MTDDTNVQETKNDEKKGASLSSKLEKIVTQLEELTVLELSEVVAALQDKWGVSAMPTASAQAPVAAVEEAAGPASNANQTVVLTSPGGNKIAVIKALREINPNLGLKEAKDLTEKLPAEILKDAKADDARAAGEKLKTAGATVEFK